MLPSLSLLPSLSSLPSQPEVSSKILPGWLSRCPWFGGEGMAARSLERERNVQQKQQRHLGDDSSGSRLSLPTPFPWAVRQAGAKISLFLLCLSNVGVSCSVVSDSLQPHRLCVCIYICGGVCLYIFMYMCVGVYMSLFLWLFYPYLCPKSFTLLSLISIWKK